MNNTFISFNKITKLKIKTMNIKQFKLDALKEVAKTLLKANNTVTTLEVKTELRTKYPDLNWEQSEIHDYFEANLNTLFKVVADNGTYRTWSLINYVLPTPTKTLIKVKLTPKNNPMNTVTTRKPDNRISRTKAYEMMKNNKGRFFTATFVKKDGEERTINCQFLKDQSELNMGYVKVRESSKLKTTPNDATRQINLQTLKSLKIAGTEYKIRK